MDIEINGGDMGAKSKYTARRVDSSGLVNYTKEDDATWKILFDRQETILEGRAVKEYIEGLNILQLPSDHIPQLHEVAKGLASTTGWGVAPVDAVIPAKEFFGLLASKRFPIATFIRSREELDYLQEPDVFHEVYGHCPLLTLKPYADFVERYAQMALQSDKRNYKYFYRLFWFTIEFGLLKTTEGLRIMGGGILSSYEETLGALEQPDETRVEFDIERALRTPYRIDMVQPQYFVLRDYDQLYEILASDIEKQIEMVKDKPDIMPNKIPVIGGKSVQFNN